MQCNMIHACMVAGWYFLGFFDVVPVSVNPVFPLFCYTYYQKLAFWLCAWAYRTNEQLRDIVVTVTSIKQCHSDLKKWKIFCNNHIVQQQMCDGRTMYDFHNSTDTLKFCTEKRAINKTFLFFIRFWWNLVKL